MSKIIRFPKKPKPSDPESFWAQQQKAERRRKFDVAATLLFTLVFIGFIIAFILR